MGEGKVKEMDEKLVISVQMMLSFMSLFPIRSLSSIILAPEIIDPRYLRVNDDPFHSLTYLTNNY